MAEMKRKSFQGVTNIIRFNWHFYLIASIVVITILFFRNFLPQKISAIIDLVLSLAVLSILISLAVSYYIYDHSNIYSLKWLDRLKIDKEKKLVNINAGFDETSGLLRKKYPDSVLTVFDFYDPAKHTEISIERARKAYPPYPDTQTISTSDVPLPPGAANYIFLILAAHEIRDDNERIVFFKQLGNALGNEGRIIVMEHQRDIYNFIAFNIGFFHFHSKNTWLNTFKDAGLKVLESEKLTQFLTIYTLGKHGTAS